MTKRGCPWLFAVSRTTSALMRMRRFATFGVVGFPVEVLVLPLRAKACGLGACRLPALNTAFLPSPPHTRRPARHPESRAAGMCEAHRDDRMCAREESNGSTASVGAKSHRPAAAVTLRAQHAAHRYCSASSLKLTKPITAGSTGVVMTVEERQLLRP